MASFENRSAAAIWAVSTGSAEAGRSQPSLGQIPALGGAEGDRTPDLVIANDALSQLSYGPVQVHPKMGNFIAHLHERAS